jgi:hypothetical protein
VPAYATVTTALATRASQPLAGAIRLALGDSATSVTIDVALGAEGIKAALASIPEIGPKVNVSKSGDADNGYRISVSCGCHQVVTSVGAWTHCSRRHQHVSL